MGAGVWGVFTALLIVEDDKRRKKALGGARVLSQCWHLEFVFPFFIFFPRIFSCARSQKVCVVLDNGKVFLVQRSPANYTTMNVANFSVNYSRLL